MKLPHTIQLERIRKLKWLHPTAEGIIVSNPENIQYFTGLTNQYRIERESLLFVTANTALLYHTPFITPPHSEAFSTQALLAPKEYQELLRKLFGKVGAEIIVEADDYKIAEYNRLKSYLPEANFKEVTDLVMPLRKIKDAHEIRFLRKAGQIVGKAYRLGIDHLKKYPQTKESELSAFLEYTLQKLGADGPAFPTIVAFDENSALPHHKPGSKKLKNGIVLVDMGAKVNGYCSDYTRTIELSRKNQRFINVEKIVKKAYREAVTALSEPTVTATAIDTAARALITEHGFGDSFIHTTGHGIGLIAHEPPSISSFGQEEIVPGMVVTIEPGIYLPGQFGYRHENTFLKTNSGCVPIT